VKKYTEHMLQSDKGIEWGAELVAAHMKDPDSWHTVAMEGSRSSCLAVTAYGGIVAYRKLGLQLLRLDAIRQELEYIGGGGTALLPLTNALRGGEYAILEWMRTQGPNPGKLPKKRDFTFALLQLGLGADQTNAHVSTHYADFAAGVATLLNALHDSVWQSQLAERQGPGTRSSRISTGAITACETPAGAVLASASLPRCCPRAHGTSWWDGHDVPRSPCVRHTGS
jgi:hypothetical protein